MGITFLEINNLWSETLILCIGNHTTQWNLYAFDPHCSTPLCKDSEDQSSANRVSHWRSLHPIDLCGSHSICLALSHCTLPSAIKQPNTEYLNQGEGSVVLRYVLFDIVILWQSAMGRYVRLCKYLHTMSCCIHEMNACFGCRTCPT